MSRRIATTQIPNGPQDRDKFLCAQFKKFNRKFKTDEDCVEELIRRIEAVTPIICGACGADEIARDYGQRVGRCMECCERVRPMAGTFFGGIKKPRIWLFILNMLESGLVFNAEEVHRVVGLAASTIRHMISKYLLVICHVGRKERGVPSKYSGLFLKSFCRRSLITTASAHPMTEQADFENENSIQTANDSDPNSNSNSNSNSVSSLKASAKAAKGSKVGSGGLGAVTAEEQKVLALLSEEPIRFDELCQKSAIGVGALNSIVMMLELKGYAQSGAGGTVSLATTKTKDQSASAKAKINPKLQGKSNSRPQISISMLPSLRLIPLPGAGNADNDIADDDADEHGVKGPICFVRENFGGISRKYLDLYMAFYWCVVDRNRWCKNNIFIECMRFGKVDAGLLRAFVTPLMVKVAENSALAPGS